MTEESLFLRIKDGDEEAVKFLYEQYRDEFTQWAVKRHQSNEDSLYALDVSPPCFNAKRIA